MGGWGTKSNEHVFIKKMGLMYSTIDSGTASKATPQGRHRKRAGRARTDDQTIASPSLWHTSGSTAALTDNVGVTYDIAACVHGPGTRAVTALRASTPPGCMLDGSLPAAPSWCGLDFGPK